MECVAKLADPVALQVLADALEAAGVNFRIEDAGMRALLPLPGVVDARVMVEDEDAELARRVLRDLGMDEGGET